MELIPLTLNVPVLLAAAMSDLRILRIPNKLVLISLALFALTAPLLPFPELAARLAAAAVVFAIGFGLFALRIVGGGDVKMLSALLLFIPSQSLTEFSLVFSLSMIAGISAILVGRVVLRTAAAGYLGISENGKIPMGVPIALAGIAHLLLGAGM